MYVCMYVYIYIYIYVHSMRTQTHILSMYNYMCTRGNLL